MNITFLGTGTSQGIPMIGCTCIVCSSMDYRDKRLRSSVHITVNELSLVIDTGPDFRQQMLRERISKVDAVLMTHSHKDHTAGLDDVRAFNYLHQMDMPVYGQPETLERLKTEFNYAFEETKYPGTPQINLFPIQDDVFQIQHVPVLPLPVMHHKLPVVGYRLGDFSYITDANFISDDTFQKLQGTKVFVINALQKEKHVAHFTLYESIDVALKVGAKQTYLTHIGHRLGKHSDVAKELPPSIALAYDGLSITM